MFELFSPIDNLTEVATDIYAIPFLTEEACSYMVEFGKKSGKWKRNIKDRWYSTVDLYLDEEFPNLYSNIHYAFHNHLLPKIEKVWLIDDICISRMFMVYYSKQVQTNLKLHHDDSFITVSVKLNNEYTGAELYFPRQGFSNKNIPIGTALIWPSQLTHPHQCTNLEEGEKFSLTIWTGTDEHKTEPDESHTGV